MAAADLAILVTGAQAWNLALTAEQRQQFDQYQSLLLTWNEQMNLTAVTDPAAVQSRHFLDSLSCTLVTGSLNGQSLIDVGSGAGFPGLPLKIVFPDLQLTLVESITKKCRFLETAVTELGLKQVSILNERVELLGRDPAHREKYDWAVARAVAALPVLAEYLLPLCRVGGAMLAMKGESAVAELATAETAVRTLGGSDGRWQPVTLPGESSSRYLITVPKTGPTPDKYPRRPGIPAKRPLR